MDRHHLSRKDHAKLPFIEFWPDHQIGNARLILDGDGRKASASASCTIAAGATPEIVDRGGRLSGHLIALWRAKGLQGATPGDDLIEHAGDRRPARAGQ
jgi:hypothetical protein